MMENVNHPEHYNECSIECIEAIRMALSEEEFMGFLLGSIWKYLWRHRKKNGVEDIEKANWYLNYANSFVTRHTFLNRRKKKYVDTVYNMNEVLKNQIKRYKDEALGTEE